MLLHTVILFCTFHRVSFYCLQMGSFHCFQHAGMFLSLSPTGNFLSLFLPQFPITVPNRVSFHCSQQVFLLGGSHRCPYVQNVPRDKTSQGQNVPRDKPSQEQNVPETKRPKGTNEAHFLTCVANYLI